jgi:hypothetical protein
VSALKQFARYADAFEATYDDDDWSRLREFFTDDAVYEAKPPFAVRAEGAEAILAHFRNSVNAFDRKFGERRLLPTQPPTATADTVTMHWEGVYEVLGAPELRMAGVETAVFRGDRICRLEDEFAPDTAATVTAWMNVNAGKLKP